MSAFVGASCMLLTCHLSSPPVWSELPQDGEAATLRALHGPQAQQTCAVHRLLPLGRAWLRAAAMPGSGASSGLVPPLRTTTAASTTAAATGSQPQPQPRRAGCGTMMDPMCDAGVRSNDDYWVMRIFYFPDFHARFLIGSDCYYWIILSSSNRWHNEELSNSSNRWHRPESSLRGRVRVRPFVRAAPKALHWAFQYCESWSRH